MNSPTIRWLTSDVRSCARRIISSWVKITLRLIATILLVLAAVRFAIEGFHSFHTKDYPLPDRRV